MAWDTEMVTMIRYQINDYSSTPTYSDDSLLTLILIAALQTQQENSFNQFYVINIDSQTLKPDPTLTAVGDNGGVNSRDDDFMWLTTLKAIMMIAEGELKQVGGQAIAIKDGDSSIDLRSTLEGKKEFYKQAKIIYDQARWRYALGTRPSGQGIFGPFAVITPSLFGQGGGFQTYTVRDRPLFN